jgi:putative drug exporter of the RND superfamily
MNQFPGRTVAAAGRARTERTSPPRAQAHFPGPAPSDPRNAQVPRPARGSRIRPPVVERIAGWSAAHRKIAVLGWLLLVAGALVVGHMLPVSSASQFCNYGCDVGQAGKAEQTLQRLNVTFPPAESVLIQVRAPGRTFASDPELRQATQQVATALRGLPHAAADVRSPLSPGGRSLVSGNGRSALVTFNVPGNANNMDQTVVPDLNAVAAVQARHPGLLIAEAGDASGDRAVSALTDSDFRRAEETSLPITLILLVAVFGALIAAGIPLLLAATCVITAISLLNIPGEWLPTGQDASEVVLLIGMAVGIDYTLFYVRREREERANGASVAQAVRIAARTSGRAIVISGLTVMIALAGLFITGAALFDGIAIGAITVVGVAVVGSLTFVPALLSWLGRWADRGRVPFLGRRAAAAKPSTIWAALARRVVRRPLLWGGVAAAAMITLAVPALGMRLGSPVNDIPGNVPIIATLNRIQQAFPQAPSPAQVVVTGSNLSGPAVKNAVAALEARASASGPIREPVTATPVAGGRGLIVNVTLAGNGTDAASNAALLDLRDKALPATLGRVSGISYATAGNTAASYDDTRRIDQTFPIVLAAVAAVAFIVLTIAFRSVTLPLVSIGLNLLSVGAAYGLITLIFQDGRFQGLLDFSSFGAITNWVPLFLFVFLFGLSMDYQRVHPEPHPRAAARRRQHPGRRDPRHRQQRRRGDQRGGDHGRGVLHLRHAAHAGAEDARHRAASRRADRRHRGPRRPGSGSHGPARRPLLASAPVAALAAGRRHRPGAGAVMMVTCLKSRQAATPG